MAWPYNTDGVQVDHDAAHNAEDRAYEKADESSTRWAYQSEQAEHLRKKMADAKRPRVI